MLCCRFACGLCIYMYMVSQQVHPRFVVFVSPKIVQVRKKIPSSNSLKIRCGNVLNNSPNFALRCCLTSWQLISQSYRQHQNQTFNNKSAKKLMLFWIYLWPMRMILIELYFPNVIDISATMSQCNVWNERVDKHLKYANSDIARRKFLSRNLIQSNCNIEYVKCHAIRFIRRCFTAYRRFFTVFNLQRD